MAPGDIVSKLDDLSLSSTNDISEHLWKQYLFSSQPTPGGSHQRPGYRDFCGVATYLLYTGGSCIDRSPPNPQRSVRSHTQSPRPDAVIAKLVLERYAGFEPFIRPIFGAIGPSSGPLLHTPRVAYLEEALTLELDSLHDCVSVPSDNACDL